MLHVHVVKLLKPLVTEAASLLLADSKLAGANRYQAWCKEMGAIAGLLTTPETVIGVVGDTGNEA